MTTKLRRTLSFVFVLAMLLSLALPALAEGTISGAEPQEILGAKDAPAGTLDAAELGAEKSREIFVSAAGSDGNDGSEAKPLATLAAAAEAANAAQENTVYVILLSDLTVGSTARFLGNNVILMSNEGACVLPRLYARLLAGGRPARQLQPRHDRGGRPAGRRPRAPER